MHSVLVMTCCLLALAALVSGHGYMVEPPNRASMWRFGYNTTKNENDNEYFCGSYEVQHKTHGGKCGPCGDNFGDARPRSNENGGTYGQGIVTRRYKAGEKIIVIVQLTGNHKGTFQFSLCKLNSSTEIEEEQCFENTSMQLANGLGKKYKVPSANAGPFAVHLKLPAGLTCDRCVLRWHYNAGNKLHFRSCADIAIETKTN